MKKIKVVFLLMLIATVLVACKGKDYKEALENGYDHLEVQAYDKAYDAFTEALTYKKKDEAKKGQSTAKTMQTGWESYDEGVWAEALEHAETIIEDDTDDLSIEIVLDDAKDLKKQTEETEQLIEEIEADFDKGLEFIEADELEEAQKLFEQIITIEHDHPIVLSLIEDAEEKLNEIDQLIKEKEQENESNDNQADEPTNETDDNDNNNNDDNQDTDSNDNNNNQNDQNDNSSNTDESDGLSEDEVTSILRNELGLPDNVKMNVDHMDGDDYIVQVYEVIEGSHTATVGWYKINKYNGEWEEIVI